jgi:hypothetical protein
MAAIQGTRVAAIKRTLSSLVSVLAAYMAYSWVVVPIVEPGVERRPNASSGSADPAGRATDLYRAELAPLFPAGAWELEHPKVLRSERGATVLWKTFDTLPDGDAATEEPAGARTFALRPCTIILYPSGRRRTSQSPDALIMQAPEGAVLTFDEPLNLQRAEFGRPVGGRLIGPIRIYGVGQQSSLAGLEIKTSNIEITNRRIWTRERVEFHRSIWMRRKTIFRPARYGRRCRLLAGSRERVVGLGKNPLVYTRGSDSFGKGRGVLASEPSRHSRGSQISGKPPARRRAVGGTRRSP